MAIRSKTQIINDALSFIANAVSNISTRAGSVVRDLIIEAPAEEFERVNDELDRTQKIQSVNFPEEITDDELDSLAANYGITRLEGKAATGSVTFRLVNFSTTSSDVNIPIGTIVSTVGADNVSRITFVTTESLFFDADLAPTYFNPSTGFYELTATIRAETIGDDTNVAAGTITEVVSNIPGVDSVVNTVSTTGGEDIESNQALSERIRIKLSGNNVGTRTGIRSLVRENPNVIDSIVVTPNDVEMKRDEFGGEVDVYIIGENLSSITDTFLYEAAGSQEFVLAHQPAKSVTSVTGIAGGSSFTFSKGTDFNFVQDTSTLVNGSTRLQNKIVFNIGGTNPDDGTNITVDYTYNKLIEDLQLEIDADDSHIITSDILVKEAVKVDVSITADVTLFPGNSSATEISNIQTALSEFINGLGLGDSIDRSDVVGEIESIDSVDQVNLNTLILEKNSVPLASTEQRLQIFKNEFPRVLTININIV